MKKLSQINSADGALALQEFALDTIVALSEITGQSGKPSYIHVINSLRETMKKQIASARHYEKIAMKGNTVRADQTRYEIAFATAKHHLEKDFFATPVELRKDFL